VGAILATSAWRSIDPETTVHLQAYPGGGWVGLESSAPIESSGVAHQLPDPLAHVGPEVVQHHLPGPQHLGEGPLDVGFEDHRGSAPEHRQAKDPIPSLVMLARSSVVFLPRLCATKPCAL
jgi:hypothetical protein